MAETTTLNPFPAVRLDLELDVRARLVDLQQWMTGWREEDERLQQRVLDLNPSRHADVLLGAQIAGLRRHLTLKVAHRPIYLDPTVAREVELSQLRAHLASQYAQLTVEERRLWLTNLTFV